MKDFVSMDRIKYRRMWAVYIPDRHNLEEEHSGVWDMFIDGPFSVQKKEIPFVIMLGNLSILKYNHKAVSLESLESITVRHFLIAPVVSTIYQEMYDMG